MAANSAPPYNITLGTDANRDGNNVDRPAELDYGSGRGDRYSQADLRLSRTFTIGSG